LLVKKKLLRTVTLFVILPALAIFVGSQTPAIAAKGQSLPPERKVREIELYVTTPDYDPIRYEFGLMAAEEWKKLGFDIKVTPLAWNRLSELGINQKDFDAFTLAWAGRAERIDPDHFAGAAQDRVMIRFSVTDTGVGIPAERLETIFHSFEIGEKVMTKRLSGPGVGLTISKYLIEKLGGKIWVESTLGEGSTFFVSLPFSLRDSGDAARPEPA